MGGAVESGVVCRRTLNAGRRPGGDAASGRVRDGLGAKLGGELLELRQKRLLAQPLGRLLHREGLVALAHLEPVRARTGGLARHDHVGGVGTMIRLSICESAS